MRHILLTCFGLTFMLTGLAGVVLGEIRHPIPFLMPTSGPWVPIPFQESPVHDWAKYKSIDLHPYGWTYTGQGSWAIGWYIPSQPQPTYQGPVLVLPGPFDEVPSPPSGEDNYNYLEDKARRSHRDLLDSGASAPRILARPRQMTPEMLARIKTLIADGDELFGHRRYSLALGRYRTAAQKGSADAHLRQGFALIALGNYKSATIAFRNALALKPDWTDDSFDLGQIYAPGALEKTNEKLSRKLAITPGQPGLLTSMCMQLHFSGDREEAGRYARQAAHIGGAESALVESFLAERKKF